MPRLSLITLCLLLLSSYCFAEELAAPTGNSKILPANAQLEELWNKGAFTEGVAVAPDGSIYFSDISSDASPGKIYRFDPSTKTTTVFSADSGKSNGLMFTREGRLMASCGANHGKMALCEIRPDGSVQPLVTHFEGKRLNSPNDLVIHPNGSVYFSDPRYVGSEPIELDHMSVYRYQPQSKSVTRVTTEITKPNGVILSPDAKTLYVAETDNGTTDLNATDRAPSKPHMTLNAFPVHKDGSLGKRRVLVNFGEKLGIDGMSVDVEGHLYAAVRSADRFGIVVYNPQGKEQAYIPTPDLPTNCCFGTGKEASTLYITAGTGLYRIRLNINGHHPATS